MGLRWAFIIVLLLGLNLFGNAAPRYRHYSKVYNIDSNAIKCQVLLDNWNTIEGEVYLKKVLNNPNFEKSNELKWLYSILNCQLNSVKHDFEPSRVAILNAIEIAHETQNPEMLIESYIVCGNLLEEQGDLTSALSYFLAAKDLLDLGNLPSRKPFILNKIGTIFYHDQNFNQAANYFFEAARLYNIYKDSVIGVHYWMQNAYGNLGLCFEELKDYKKSLFYFKMALNVINLGYFSKERPLGVIYANMGHVYLSMGDLKNAKKYYEKGIRFTLDPNQRELRHGSKKQLELAKILIQLNQTKEARLKIDSSLKIINSQNLGRLKGAYYNTEMAYYEKLGNVKLALDFSKKYNLFQDSIHQIQIKMGLSKQILRHSLNQKITENELLQKNNKLNQYRNRGYLGILIALALLFLGIIYVLRLQNKQNTELNAALTEIESQKQELQVSNSNINYLLQTVAHDLRTPVGNNLSLSNLLLDSYKLHHDDKEMVKLMNTSSQHALSIMEDLLDHSLIERGEIILNTSTCNLNELLNEAIQILKYKAEPKNINLVSEIPSNPFEVNIDASRISRVIQNLIANAIKFSQRNESIFIKLYQSESSFVISVKDNGIGMDEKTIKLAFDSFTSVGRTGTSGEKSYGLGLSICKKLIELHSGKLWADSIPGFGSTFYIEIPNIDKS